MTAVKAWFVSVGGSLLLVLLVAGAAVAGNVPAVDNRMRGKVDAPVTMIEYSDFTCGYCLKFFKETWPKIQARYVDTGKVRFLYKDYPRADQGPGLTAALAARCAGDQGTYWPMHDRLFSADGRLDADSYTATCQSDRSRSSRSFGNVCGMHRTCSPSFKIGMKPTPGDFAARPASF